MSRATIRVSEPCGRTLHSDLEAAGVRVGTVRADYADVTDRVTMHAVVVIEDARQRTLAESVIAAHTAGVRAGGPKPSRTMTAQEKEDSLSRMEKL